MKESEKIRVKVDIFGIEYNLLADTSAIHVRKMAAMVDELMTKNDKIYPRLEQSKLAVLSALQLADQHIQLEQELQQLKDTEIDSTQSPAYRKLREEHTKLRDDYTKLKQLYLDLKARTDRTT